MQRRNTIQRLAVFEAIEALGHATSDELIKYLGKIHSDVSLATIYRNLSILIDDRQVKKLKLGNSDIYETIKEKHYHFICNGCNKIIDIPINYINMKSIPDDILDNTVIDYDLVLFGYCKECKTIRKEDEK